MNAKLERMIETQIVRRGVTDARVLDAMRSWPREWFLPASLQRSAYDDTPLSIGCGQTISQPFIVAFMSELARVTSADRVLEVGTGSVYQTAILSSLAKAVYSAELEPELARSARLTIDRLRLRNVVFREGDALSVFRDDAPFDVILSAAAPEVIPQELIDMLAKGGRLVIPAGPTDNQTLWVIERDGTQLRRSNAGGVRFVPLRRQSPE